MAPNTIYDNYGARKQRKIVGRGNGSGYGKTAGRGHNGQKSRPGFSMSPAFIGGQNPLTKRLPKKGINRNRFKQPLEEINVSNLIYYIQKKRLDPTKTITMKDLFNAGALTKIKYGVKVLGKGAEKLSELGYPLHLEVSDASQTVIDAVKANGGSITAVHHTETTLRRLLKPHKFTVPEAKIPMPKPKKVLKYEKMREKGLEVKYPPAPWYEEHKAKLDKALKEAEAREKTPGEKILPKLPAAIYPGVNLDKPKVERELLPKEIKYPYP